MRSECASRKHPYDISKSKRTRRAPHVASEGVNTNVTVTSPSEGLDSCKEEDEQAQTAGETTNGHLKLKQFIHVDLQEKDVSTEKDQRRDRLDQHFADEKQLQLVIKQPENGPEVAKFMRAAKRYLKALSHLVKSKSSRRLEKAPRPIK